MSKDTWDWGSSGVRKPHSKRDSDAPAKSESESDELARKLPPLKPGYYWEVNYYSTGMVFFTSTYVVRLRNQDWEDWTWESDHVDVFNTRKSKIRGIVKTAAALIKKTPKASKVPKKAPSTVVGIYPGEEIKYE